MMHPLDVERAAAMARSLGIDARVVQTLAPPIELLLSLTTTDRDPTVSVLESGGSTATLLEEREESGPDRWDYSLQVQGSGLQIALELAAGSSLQLVPALPIGFSHLAEHGWTPPTDRPLPVLVDRTALEAAIASLQPANPIGTSPP